MYEELALPRLLNYLELVLDEFPDERTGKNTRYDLPDAGLGAFSVFFTQSASFLAHQRALKLTKGRCNAERLFGLRQLPSDNQIRNLLDPVSPGHLGSMYRHVFQELERQAVLKRYRSFGQQLLVAMDGTAYFASKEIHCPNCSQRVLTNGDTQYFHSVLTPVLVQPGNPQVLALEPEFIVPQDTHLTVVQVWACQTGLRDPSGQALAGTTRRFLCPAGRDRAGRRPVQPTAFLPSADRPPPALYSGV